jgi:hypothetical protein
MKTLGSLWLSAGMILSLVGMPLMTAALIVAPATIFASPSAPSGHSLGAAADPAADILQAREFLDGLQEKYDYLDGVTVSGGATPSGHEAVAYYREGRIVISPTRSASVEDILAHEVWHIIDWRDNGRIDWGENVPPTGWAAYLKK